MAYATLRERDLEKGDEISIQLIRADFSGQVPRWESQIKKASWLVGTPYRQFGHFRLSAGKKSKFIGSKLGLKIDLWP